MGRHSILPQLQDKLERLLERIVEEWRSQPEGDRVPTLPLINDKVNVRKLAGLCNFTGAQEQHLFKKPELRSLVNAVALEQGVELIGSSIEDDEDEDAVTKRLRRIQAERSELSKTLAEREAVIERQRREIESLRGRIAFLEGTGLVLRLGEVR